MPSFYYYKYLKYKQKYLNFKNLKQIGGDKVSLNDIEYELNKEYFYKGTGNSNITYESLDTLVPLKIDKNGNSTIHPLYTFNIEKYEHMDSPNASIYTLVIESKQLGNKVRLNNIEYELNKIYFYKGTGDSNTTYKSLDTLGPLKIDKNGNSTIHPSYKFNIKKYEHMDSPNASIYTLVINRKQ